MAEQSRVTVTLVQGPDDAANKEALHLMQSFCGYAVETVRTFRAVAEWMETPRVITADGYVVSGLESIREFARKVNGQ